MSNSSVKPVIRIYSRLLGIKKPVLPDSDVDQLISKTPVIVFKILISSKYFNLGHEFDLKFDTNLEINKRLRLKDFISSVIRSDNQDTIIDTSETFVRFSPDYLEMRPGVILTDYELIIELLSRIRNEIDYHMYGTLCQRDSFSMDELDEQYLRDLVDRVKPDEVIDYPLYKVAIKESLTGFKILFGGGTHIGYHEVIIPERRKVFNKKTFMDDIISEYGIMFNEGLKSVNLGDTEIRGLVNVTRVFLLLTAVTRFEDLNEY